MKYVLIAAAVSDVGCLLWLFAVAIREPRKIRDRFRHIYPIPVCYLAAAVLGYEVCRRSFPVSLSLFLLLWLIYCGAMTIITAQRYRRAQDDAVRQMQIERHYAQEEEYYTNLLEKQEQTRALWHDLNKYLKAADLEQHSDSIMQAKRQLVEASDVIDTGNRVLNVILNEYSAQAEAVGAKLTARVNVPPVLPFSVADLYILLGNPLDNAIRAMKSLPIDQREIALAIRLHNDVFFYQIQNAYDPAEKSRPREGHGYGLKNIRACLKRYHGSLEITDDNGVFTLSAHLNLPA